MSSHASCTPVELGLGLSLALGVHSRYSALSRGHPLSQHIDINHAGTSLYDPPKKGEEGEECRKRTNGRRGGKLDAREVDEGVGVKG